MEPLSKEDYVSAHFKFQPRGLIWKTRPGSLFGKLYAAFSRALVRVHTTLLLLVRELDPRSASALLPEWEAFAGLPDKCSLVEASETERRAAVVSKITATGGSSATYFIQLAASLGYPGATVTEFPVGRFGRARFGSRFQGRAWRHVWQLNLQTEGSTRARFTDRFGTRFQTNGNFVLECRVVKLKPSHTKVLFYYGA